MLLKILTSSALLLTLVCVALIGPQSVQAQLTTCQLTPSTSTSYAYSPNLTNPEQGNPNILGPTSSIPLQITTAFGSSTLDEYYDPSTYEIGICNENANGILTCNPLEYTYHQISSGAITRSGNTFSINLPASNHTDGEFRAVLRAARHGSTNIEDVCPNFFPAFITTASSYVPPNCQSLSYNPRPLTPAHNQVTVSFNTTGINDPATYWLAFDESNVSQSLASQRFTKDSPNLQGGGSDSVTTVRNGSQVTATFGVNDVTNGGSILLMGTRPNGNYAACTINITYNPATGQTGDENVGGSDIPGSGQEKVEFYLCRQIPDGTARGYCEECAIGNGVWTAVGCIQTDAQTIIRSVMRLGLGIAGGVALIMILGAGFLYSTSQGDVKRTGEARDMMTSAIIGLLFIIFSVTILQFIGVSILQIPGFGGP